MSKVRSVRRQLIHCLVGVCMLVPASVLGQVIQQQVFYDRLLAACNASADPNFLNTVCNKAFVGTSFGSGTTYSGGSANVGSAGGYSTGAKAAALQRQSELEDEDAKKRRRRGGGSGDFTAGAFGGFVTAQKSKTTRALTDLENGYNADLDGLLVGLDRRFGGDLIAGATLGRTDTDSVYMNDAGTSKARNTTLLFYGTYLPGPSTYLGAYLGSGRGTLDATRRAVMGTISGTVTSSTDTAQTLAGLSGGYNWYSGALSIAATTAVDYLKSRTDGTREMGTTGLEFDYPAQYTTSLTGSLGTRASYRASYAWGAIVPSLRAAYVHEFKDNSRVISPRLVINPAATFDFNTDAPDRNYLVAGGGVTIEAGRGAQLFVDYEKRSGHRFIETWAASLGAIFEF